jgi:hypothetical protein
VHETAWPSWEQVRAAVADSCLLAVSCLITYWLAIMIVARAHSVSKADDVLGGMWAVIAACGQSGASSASHTWLSCAR